MCNLKEEFQHLKNEYIKNQTELKTIIGKMQENLKKRTKEKTVQCLGCKECRVDSDNVEELFAIDGFLSAQESSSKMTAVADDSRKTMEKINKYGPSNPYTRP